MRFTEIIKSKSKPAKAAGNEDMQVLELVRTGKLNKNAALQLLRRVDLKKAGIVAGGALTALFAVNIIGQYRFYRGIVAKELRRQLAPLERKLDELQQENEKLRAELTRQKPEDRYDYKAVIAAIKAALPGIPVVTDDNYAALKVDAIGCQAGADLSTFSCFKILGPEGVGAVIGSKELINRIYKMQYSGGSQVQGHEAMEALRGLIYAPVALAIQSEVNEELVRRLNAGEVPHVRQAFLANAQSKVLLVEFDQEIAEKILDAAPKFGAAPHPVGSESKYEFAPMIYRVSGTFRAQDPTIEHRMIRINPMRSGPDTIIRILRSCMEQVEEN